MKKYILPTLKNTEDIGNTVGELNRSFKDLNSFFEKEKEKSGEVDTFIKNLSQIFNKMEQACNIMEKNKNTFFNLSQTVKDKKVKWLKPIVLFYNEKFYDNPSIFSFEYIEDRLCKWMQLNYPVKKNDVDKPLFVEGQTALIFYMKSKDSKASFSYSNETFVNCLTQNVSVSVSCSSRAVGKACVSNCGCVNCNAVIHCSKSETLGCYYRDRNLNLQSVNRYLKINSKYINDDSWDTSIFNVKLIVNDCEWNIDKSV